MSNHARSLPHVPRRSSTEHSTVSLAADGGALDHELEARWGTVKSRLSVVLRNMQDHPLKTRPAEWVHIYTDVAKLYTQNDSLRKRRMYIYVRQFIKDLVAVQLHHLQPLGGTLLLSEYVRRWRSTMTYVNFMKRVLHHLQRFWISEHANTLKCDPVRPLDKLLMFYWREDLLSNLHSVVDIALSLIDDDRRGVPIDHAAVRGIVENFVEIGAADLATPTPPSEQPSSSSSAISDQLCTLHLYLQVFEEPFLVHTGKFYKEEAANMVQHVDVSTFIKRILSRLDDEHQRVCSLLHKDSAPRVRRVAEEQLIGNHKEYLQTEATKMIQEGREHDLRLVYDLLTRVEDGLGPIRSFFVAFVRAEGNSVVVKHADNLNGKEGIRHNLILVELLIRLYLKHSSLVKRCFSSSNMLLLAIDDAFRGFVNRSLGPVSLPNLLAHYIDQLLRSHKPVGSLFLDLPAPSSQNPSETEKPSPAIAGPVDNQVSSSITGESNETGVDKDDPRAQYLSELIRFFMYLEDKDMFFETHRRLFAKRLLGNHDEHIETLFISKLRVQMGTTYTQRLSGMLQDIMISNSLREQFSSHLREKRETNLTEGVNTATSASNDLPNPDTIAAMKIDFNGHVLSALHWPSVKAGDLKVPPVLKACHQLFSDFYMRNKETRKLSWVHTMSVVHLKGIWGAKNYTFVVSTYQASILLLFNDREKICVSEAASLLNITADELRRHIKPLLVGKKTKVLELKKHVTSPEAVGTITDGTENDCEEAQTTSDVDSVVNCAGQKPACDEVTANNPKKRKRSDGTKAAKNGQEHPRTSKKVHFAPEVDNGSKQASESEEGSRKESDTSGKDILCVNPSFTSRLQRVMVPALMPKLASTEATTSKNKVVMDRSTQVDAAMVRIMKAKKKITHVDLCAEVIAHLSSHYFIPDPKLIKTRLERLIDQEYVTRDEKDARLYTYNA